MPFDASNFIKGLQKLEPAIAAAARRGADIAGEHVLGDAQELAPVDTGDLKASGMTLPATIQGTEIRKVIGFTMGYAAAVHENLTAHHKSGQAKYLETAMNRSAVKVRDFIIQTIKSEVG